MKQSKWFKAVERSGVAVEHRPVAPPQLPGWIVARARSRGLAMDKDAALLLAHFTEGNLLAAAQEIDKIELLRTGEGEIGYDMVAQGITDSARFNVFGLVDQCLAGNAKQALRTLEGLRREGVEAVLIVWILAKQIRTLYRLAVGRDAGQPMTQLFKAFRVWYKQESLVGSALKRHPRDGWAGLLQDMSMLDRLAKGRAEGDIWDALERSCLFLCGVNVGGKASMK